MFVYVHYVTQSVGMYNTVGMYYILGMYNNTS